MSSYRSYSNDKHTIDYIVYGSTSLLAGLSTYLCYRYVVKSNRTLNFMNTNKPITINELSQKLNDNETVIAEVEAKSIKTSDELLLKPVYSGGDALVISTECYEISKSEYLDTNVYTTSTSTVLTQTVNSKTSNDLLFSNIVGALNVTDQSNIIISVPLDTIENDLYIETKKLIPYQDLYNWSPLDVQLKWGFSTNLQNFVSNLSFQFVNDLFSNSRRVGLFYCEKVIRENRPVYLLGKFYKSRNKIEYTNKDVEYSCLSTSKNAAISKQNASSFVFKIIGFTSLVISLGSALAIGYIYKSETVDIQDIFERKF